MASRNAPVAHGSRQSTTVTTGSAIVTDVRFPAGATLPSHTHDRTVFGVMLEGAFVSEIVRRRVDCRVGTAWTEPLGEPHANVIGPAGARVLVVQPDHTNAELFEPLRGLLADVRMMQTAGLCEDAARVAGELTSSDPCAHLAVDALVMLLLVSAARLATDQQHHGGPPRWLVRTRDTLHETFNRPPELAELARNADVSASHLVHSFRKHFAMTPGEYVRRVRVQWAADQLRITTQPISQIALAAGYCDQSHLNRELRSRFGVAPATFRRRVTQES